VFFYSYRGKFIAVGEGGKIESYPRRKFDFFKKEKSPNAPETGKGEIDE
jgi:hypothetical protein